MAAFEAAFPPRVVPQELLLDPGRGFRFQKSEDQ